MTDYRQAGVNIDAGEDFVQRISPLVRSTFRPEVLGGLGGFGGLFQLPIDRYKEPILVSGTDGVGTKLKLAFLLDRHDTIGIDLVAMCVNDIIVSGAEPLFFLDYLAVGHLCPEQAQEVVRGIVDGCRQAGCALIGGETAEMPSFYKDGEYELAGFAVGIVEKKALVNGANIQQGDAVIGLASTGLHSNGYSLARTVLFDTGKLEPSSTVPGYDLPLGDILLTPTKIYAKSIVSLLQDFPVHGLAHITGGGLTGNIPRILPKYSQVRIDPQAWTVPPIFTMIQEIGQVEEEEMFRVFNMGIGFILIIPAEQVGPVLERIAQEGEHGVVIGNIVQGEGETPVVSYQ
ncbi:MAG: phosphoribosylformylglycinamidine cyclo-ligase [Nitrospirales bacterium]|nr:phosphoribosylformylglycinamidine cyclo-ligase [Nitrospirales bacterium]